MRIYLIAGEASGDLHGSNLVMNLRRMLPGIDLRGLGGDRMAGGGVHLVKHFRHQNFMGFVEVLAHLPRILRIMRDVKKDILDFKPDAVILIDYPAFNLPVARFCKSHGLQVIYYISPQVWAWKEGRVKYIKRYVDRMICILPFEPEFYHRHGIDSYYVGHPLLDAIRSFTPTPLPFQAETPVMAILPGSRKMEIRRMLPAMLEAAGKLGGGFQFVIAAAESLPENFFESFDIPDPIQIVRGRTYDLLSVAKAAMVTSGTATLETALFGVPQVVCYRGNPLSYWLARRLIKVQFISLVNLILGKPLVTELIQNRFTAERVQQEIQRLLDPEVRDKVLMEYRSLTELVGAGSPSEKAARFILDFLEENRSAK
jgi:lipid-A-disaccharide synthase